jgi:alpha-L-rhamnosidase
MLYSNADLFLKVMGDLIKDRMALDASLRTNTLPGIYASGAYEALLKKFSVWIEKLTDVMTMLAEKNEFTALLGKGWHSSRLMTDKWAYKNAPAIICVIEINYQDGSTDYINSDVDFSASGSPVQFSEIYDGETFDARVLPQDFEAAVICDYRKDILIPQVGDYIREIEELKPASLFKTPKGETVIDFGQNMTGYVRFNPRGKSGDLVELSHAEVLDKDGNFYTENLRSAKQKII